MNEYYKQIAIPIDNPLNAILSKEDKYSFLVGAGISMEKPSNIPSAPQFVKLLLNIYAPPEDVKAISELKFLRYETIVERIQNIADPDLKFLDYLEEVKNPNIIHYFLANAMMNGSPIFTTNFDYLIENAINNISNEDSLGKIAYIIEKQDYTNFNSELGKIPYIKLHGSKKNFFTGKNTDTSLVTTIKALGKDKVDTFGLEPYKENIFRDNTKNSTLIVMGYSGSDDFDISPTLKAATEVKRLIWIDHRLSEQDNDSTFEIYKIKDASEGLDMSNAMGIDVLLCDIVLNSEIEVYRINGNTAKIIESFWNILIHEDTYNKLIFEGKETIRFEEWAQINLKEPNLYSRYKFACDLLSLSADHKNLQKTIERGMNLGNEAIKAYCLMNLGFNKSFESKYEECISYLKESVDLFLNSNKFEDAIYVNINLGESYSRLIVDLPKATLYFQNAMELLDKYENLEYKARLLMDLGILESRKSNIESADVYFKQALSIVEKEGFLGLKMEIIQSFAYLSRLKGDVENTFKYLNEALRIGKELGLVKKLTYIEQELGNLYYENGMIEKAIEIYLDGIKHAEISNDIPSIELTNSYIAILFSREKQYEKAEIYFNKAMEYIDENNAKTEDGYIFSGFGDFYFFQEEYDKSLEYYKKAIDLGIKFSHDDLIAHPSNQIGRIYYRTKKYIDALKFYKLSLEKAESMHIERTFENLKMNLYSTYNRINESLDEEYLKVLKAENLYDLEPRLVLLKNEFIPREKFVVQIYSKLGLDPSAWVGIMSSEIPHNDEIIADQNQLAYIYMGKKVYIRGTFYAPEEVGNYELRLYDNDDNGNELISVSFKVIQKEIGIEIEKTEFKSNEPIEISYFLNDEYSEDAWIGLFNKAQIDEVIENFETLALSKSEIKENKVGNVTLLGPKYAGNYIIRLFKTKNDPQFTHEILIKISTK